MASDVWRSAISDFWNNDAEWTLGAAPATSDAAFFPVSGNYTVTLTTPTSLTAIYIANTGVVLNDETAGATLSLSGDLVSYGSLGLDNYGGTGGTAWSIGGRLRNAGTMTVGCGDGYNPLTATATVDIAGGLVNTGVLNLVGGVSPQAVVMRVAGAAGLGAVGALTGSVNLSGDALLRFDSGSINRIALASTLTINGAGAFLADAGATASNSALTGLSAVTGTLNWRMAPSSPPAAILKTPG